MASTSKGPGRTEPEWRSSKETMEYLSALHGELYPSPIARELKLKINALYKGFHAREKIQKNSYQQNCELTRSQTGYSRRRKQLHEHHAAENQGQLGVFEELAVGAEDDN